MNALALLLHLAFLKGKAMPSETEASEPLRQYDCRHISPLAHAQRLTGVQYSAIDLCMYAKGGRKSVLFKGGGGYLVALFESTTVD